MSENTNTGPSAPDGMKFIDVSKLDPAKVKAIKDKLSNVGFSVGESGSPQDDQYIEGVDSGEAGAVRRDPDGTGVRITFKQPKRSPPPVNENLPMPTDGEYDLPDDD